MLSEDGSYNVHSNANMTQLSTGQISKHLRPIKHESKERSVMHAHARKRSCQARNVNRACVFLKKCKVSLKQQSADLLGKQNTYPTSIVSAQDRCLHSSHRANARIRARTRKHKQTYTQGGKASKRKGQDQEDKQERRVTCTHLEAKLHV